MDIGVLHETKTLEDRVAFTPAGVREAVAHGHDVIVEAGAGVGSRIADATYDVAGATIVESGEEVYERARLILHVKEPQERDLALLQPHHLLFTYLHLAAYPDVGRALVDAGCTAVAYETVQLDDGSLPLLAPMSHIAGRMSVQAGAHYLEAAHGGKGILLGGAPGVPGAKVCVIGAGEAGMRAVDVAVGSGAQVTVLDIDVEKLAHAEELWGGRVVTDYSSRLTIEQWVEWADLVIGAVLVAGGRAPVIVSKEMVDDMEAGSVLVDISIDQGGCFETSRETTHADPVYDVSGVVHYCVGNIPAQYRRRRPTPSPTRRCATALPLPTGSTPPSSAFPSWPRASTCNAARS